MSVKLVLELLRKKLSLAVSTVAETGFPLDETWRPAVAALEAAAVEVAEQDESGEGRLLVAALPPPPIWLLVEP